MMWLCVTQIFKKGEKYLEHVENLEVGGQRNLYRNHVLQFNPKIILLSID